jgi:hypothetical protein
MRNVLARSLVTAPDRRAPYTQHHHELRFRNAPVRSRQDVRTIDLPRMAQPLEIRAQVQLLFPK